MDAEQQQHTMAEQVKEYQARSRHAWAAASFFSSTSSTSTTGSSWVEVLFVIWELALYYALLVFACIAIYFKFIGIALSFTCISALLYLCMRLTKEERKHKKSKQRMLLPLSM